MKPTFGTRQKIFSAVLLLLLVWGGYRHWDALKQSFARALSAEVGPLLVAVAAALLAMVCMAEVLRSLLTAGGTHTGHGSTLRLAFIANSWSSTLPAGQAFAALYSFRTMKSWGATNLVCSWQIVLSGLMSTMWLLTLGVIGVLFLGASIPPASIIVPLLAAGSVFWLIQHPDVLLPAARWVCAIVGKPAWAELAELQLDRLKSVKLTAPRFVWVSALSLGNWVFDIVALWACMWAVTGHAVVHAVEGPTTGPAVTGVILAFVTAKIAGSVQATPGGLGPVETAMTGTLVAVGMTGVDALGTVLIYRLITFFMVTGIGWIVYAATKDKLADSVREQLAEE